VKLARGNPALLRVTSLAEGNKSSSIDCTMSCHVMLCITNIQYFIEHTTNLSSIVHTTQHNTTQLSQRLISQPRNSLFSVLYTTLKSLDFLALRCIAVSVDGQAALLEFLLHDLEAT